MAEDVLVILSAGIESLGDHDVAGLYALQDRVLVGEGAVIVVGDDFVCLGAGWEGGDEETRGARTHPCRVETFQKLPLIDVAHQRLSLCGFGACGAHQLMVLDCSG